MNNKAFKTELIQLKQHFLSLFDKTDDIKVKWLLDAKIIVVEHILLMLHKIGDNEMKPQDLNMVIETVSLADIKQSRSKVDETIIELGKTMAPNDAKRMNPEAVKWPYFRNRVYTLRKEGLVPQDIKPMINGEKFYLVKEEAKA